MNKLIQISCIAILLIGCNDRPQKSLNKYISNEHNIIELNYLNKGKGSQIILGKDNSVISLKNSNNQYLSGPQIEFYDNGNIKSIRIIDSILMKCDTIYKYGKMVINCKGYNIDHYINLDMKGNVTSSFFKQNEDN